MVSTQKGRTAWPPVKAFWRRSQEGHKEKESTPEHQWEKLGLWTKQVWFPAVSQRLCSLISKKEC